MNMLFLSFLFFFLSFSYCRCAYTTFTHNAQLHEVFPDDDYLSDADLACDIVCLLYDVSNPYSFEYCAKVFKVTTRSFVLH